MYENNPQFYGEILQVIKEEEREIHIKAYFGSKDLDFEEKLNHSKIMIYKFHPNENKIIQIDHC